MNASVLTAVAWPYANGPRHIGHVSGFGVPSDIFSRYQRMAGNRVLMVSGTDENGTPIQVQADAEGITPRQLADKYNRLIVEDLLRAASEGEPANTAIQARARMGRSEIACRRIATDCRCLRR